MQGDRSYIKTVLYAQMISLLLKKRCDIFSEGNAAHPLRCESLLQAILAVWHTFSEFELTGSGVSARGASDYNG
jgi:hypothetical protein